MLLFKCGEVDKRLFYDSYCAQLSAFINLSPTYWCTENLSHNKSPFGKCTEFVVK